MIESGFYQALSGTPSITSVVGSNIFRVFRKAMPVPSVVFQLISRGSVYSFDGRNALEEGRYQFDSYGADPDTVVRLADAIKTLFVPLDSFSNNYPIRLPDGSSITSSVIHMEEDLGPEIGDGGNYIYRRLLDIEFSFVSS